MDWSARSSMQATMARMPSPTATFVVCIPMGSPVARDVPETIFACIATMQANPPCDKGTVPLSHSVRVAGIESRLFMRHWSDNLDRCNHA